MASRFLAQVVAPTEPPEYESRPLNHKTWTKNQSLTTERAHNAIHRVTEIILHNDELSSSAKKACLKKIRQICINHIFFVFDLPFF